MSKEKAAQRINNNGNRSNRQAAPVTIIFVVILAVAVIGVVVWFVTKKDVGNESANMVVTPDNVEEVIENLEVEQRIPVGSYEVTMNNQWTFADGTSASENAYVSNSVNNQYTVYFTIVPNGSEEIIYTSPYLPVGSNVANIVLDKDLDAGVYDTVLTYHLVDSSLEEVSSVSVGLTITIEN